MYWGSDANREEGGLRGVAPVVPQRMPPRQAPPGVEKSRGRPRPTRDQPLFSEPSGHKGRDTVPFGKRVVRSSEEKGEGGHPIAQAQGTGASVADEGMMRAV